jgi:ferrous iron transport protein B
MSGRYVLSRRALALLLLQQDEEVAGLVRKTEGDGFAALEAKAREIGFERRESFHLDLSMERREIVRELVKDVMVTPEKRFASWQEKLAVFSVKPLTGIPLLLIVLYFGLYQFVGVFGAGTLVDLLEGKVFEEHFNPGIT